jgi:mannose-6-phosphate isomerase-like protein (cupin superfamily)
MKTTVDEALARLPGPPNALWPQGARSVSMFSHGTMELKLYAPRGSDPQQPHTRDEVYIVVSGHGRFDNDGKVASIGPGDALFVAAGRPHRFLDFSDDFATWVIFYGPEGGEPHPARAT